MLSVIYKSTLSAINSTATATAAQVAGGTITSTSAAATSITLPTATLLATQLNATQGTSFIFTSRSIPASLSLAFNTAEVNFVVYIGSLSSCHKY